jgi:large subunit ribosomal protein L17
MRHAKRSAKLSRTTSHRRCMFANMLKSLICNEMVTTVPKAKELRRFAEKMVTLAKDDSLAHRRLVMGRLMVQYNTLTPKEKRAAKGGDTSSYTDERRVIEKLFTVLAPRFANRNGGYTRISRLPIRRIGDAAETCVIEYLPA